jgi:hypothetical protein
LRVKVLFSKRWFNICFIPPGPLKGELLMIIFCYLSAEVTNSPLGGRGKQKRVTIWQPF